jgi:hypothetical protein
MPFWICLLITPDSAAFSSIQSGFPYFLHSRSARSPWARWESEELNNRLKCLTNRGAAIEGESKSFSQRATAYWSDFGDPRPSTSVTRELEHPLLYDYGKVSADSIKWFRVGLEEHWNRKANSQHQKCKAILNDDQFLNKGPNCRSLFILKVLKRSYLEWALNISKSQPEIWKARESSDVCAPWLLLMNQDWLSVNENFKFQSSFVPYRKAWRWYSHFQLQRSYFVGFLDFRSQYIRQVSKDSFVQGCEFIQKASFADDIEDFVIFWMRSPVKGGRGPHRSISWDIRGEID